ncbi:MAG TPA: hypothetical protein VNY07_03190 [Chthoniobacterales bacterium]|nr:hypothetical protein [Chthoniobacterales bacterium]
MSNKKQTAWCSRVRVLGLLLLIDYICRNDKKNGVISISADLARSFVSKLRKKDCSTSVTEPLLLLCEIGILRRIRPATFAHVKTSAVYRLADAYRDKQIAVEVLLTPKLAHKRTSADVRCEKRLNRRFPCREKLLADLGAISFANSARSIIAKGLASKGSENLTRLVSAVDARQHFVKVSERGQITTSIGSCPRDLQPHLLLDGEPVASCDIANAHWNFLPRILAERLDYVSGSPGRQNYINDGWREHNRLVAFLSDGDFYREWCVDPEDDAERNQKKTVLNMLLNQKNDICLDNQLYRRIRAEFPITVAATEDIKRKDHRNVSKQLHRFVADAVTAALIKMQQKGIAAIPRVDALICRRKDHALVCEALGSQIFLTTGVCAKVGGIRYSPLSEEEEEALGVDETVLGDLNYHERQAVCLIRFVAALKLITVAGQRHRSSFLLNPCRFASSFLSPRRV